MPSESKSWHPSGLGLTFHEDGHAYIDDLGRHYLSTTSLSKPLWPPFDVETMAARVAIRDGKTPDQVRREWAAKGERASTYGTKIHQIIEQTIADHLGHALKFPRIAIVQEDHARAQWVARMIIEQATNIFGTELVVFSPRYFIAGTIDLLVEFPDYYGILDAKTNQFEKLSPDHDGHRAWNHNARHGIGDSPLTKYGLQLSTYEHLLRHEYGFTAKPFKRVILHMPGDHPTMAPQFYELPSYVSEVQEILDDSVPEWAQKTPGLALGTKPGEELRLTT